MSTDIRIRNIPIEQTTFENSDYFVIDKVTTDTTVKMGAGNVSNQIVGRATINTGNTNSQYGNNAGVFLADGVTPKVGGSNCVYLGSNARALANNTNNEIVIGASAIGNGSNTVTIGDNNITRTILRGNVEANTFIASNRLRAGGNYYNVLSWNFNGTLTNGVKIKTNIPYTNSSHMPTIIIEGYDYGTANTVGIMLVWYVIGGNFVNHKASSYGGITPTIQLANESGLVTIYLDWRPNYGRITVKAFAQGMSEQAIWFDGWTVADEVAGTQNQVTVPYYNRFSNTDFAGNISMSGNINMTGNITMPGNIHMPGNISMLGNNTNTNMLTIRQGIVNFNNNNNSQNWRTAVVININNSTSAELETNPNRSMRFVQLGGTAFGAGIAWGMSPQADNNWLSGAYSTGQYLLAYNGQTLTLQGSNQNPGATPTSFNPTTFITITNQGNVTLNNGDLSITSGKQIYLAGNETTNGSWRMNATLNGSMLIQKREAGVWVTKQTLS